MIGGQTKTPTISVLFERKTDFIGGAGAVAGHMAAAGADTTFSTVLGDDPLKDFVLERLDASGIRCRAIIDPTRPTTNKNAVVTAGYQLLKIDTLDNSTISDSVLGELTQRVKDTPADAVVFSDFRHGIFNRRTLRPNAT
jgi:bifunctional ADP-heptose synthase (sugar kinase/adenylyltransferase)